MKKRTVLSTILIVIIICFLYVGVKKISYSKYDLILNNINDTVFLYANYNETSDGIYKSILAKTKEKQKIFNWQCTTKETFYPTVEYLDNDKVFICMTHDEGTGVKLEDAHILDKKTLKEYEIEDPIKILDENITINDNEIIAGKTYISIDLPDGNFKYEIEADANTFNKASYGSIVKFHIVDDILISSIGIQYSPVVFLDNSLDVYYKFDNGKYVYDYIVLSVE